ncbi:hypothetical protein F0L74_31420 [Chitinophaga agrisoli]|uniref:Uncharacterized protein n=1 Tax=Chitinophaga agrisoli TaxID=2607653 RepID=A0A5B2VPQ1_9BACT|nr:hypothetical protein [Chitinophaga agrisoli]KAA2240658.1 hypothetical protein F0L74_31420 [Chitinophaga agrisoli]
MKKNLICVLAVVLAVAAVSYARASKRDLASQWFFYQDDNDGIAFTVDEARNVNFYVEANGVNPSITCNGLSKLCAIFAQTDNNHRPIITENNAVDAQIVTFFNTGFGGSLIKRVP